MIEIKLTNEEARHVEKLLDNEASQIQIKIDSMLMDGQFRAKQAAEQFDKPEYLEQFHKNMAEYMGAYMVVKAIRDKLEDVLDSPESGE